MEAQTATTLGSAATGSKTLADLLSLAVEKHADLVAQKYKDQSKGEWVDVSYPELGEIVKEVSLGLQDLGIERGDKVAILSNTRPEWTYADFAILGAAGDRVPIYQTNSPEECHYVLDHSESIAVILEDQEQLDKVRKVRGDLPEASARHLDGGARRRRRDQPRRAARARPRAFRRGLQAAHRLRRAAPTSPRTSTRPGPPALPRAASSTTRTGATCWTWSQTQNVLMEKEVAYLFLPLAHAFARLIQLGSIDVGATIVYWERDAQKIIPNLMEVKPTYFPSVPRMFEKIYSIGDVERARQGAGRAGRAARHEGTPDAGARRDRAARSSRSRSTRPTPRCSRTCATSSAAGSSRPSRAPRRSRRRSSSSSMHAA